MSNHEPPFTTLLECGCFVFSDSDVYELVLGGQLPFAGVFEKCVFHGEQTVRVVIRNGSGATIEMPVWEDD